MEHITYGQEFDIRQLMYEQSHKRRDGGTEANTGKNYLEYREALTLIRDVMNSNHTSELAAILEDISAANYIKFLIARYIREFEINVNGMGSLTELVNAVYDSMAGFDFLTEYIYRSDVEEINGNAWNDIEIVTTTGWEKVPKHFA